MSKHRNTSAHAVEDVDAPRQTADRADQLRLLWAMSPNERIAAMRRGELSLIQLAAWSRRYPDQVPRIGREFEWIVMSLADTLDARELPAVQERT